MLNEHQIVLESNETWYDVKYKKRDYSVTKIWKKSTSIPPEKPYLPSLFLINVIHSFTHAFIHLIILPFFIVAHTSKKYNSSCRNQTINFLFNTKIDEIVLQKIPVPSSTYVCMWLYIMCLLKYMYIHALSNLISMALTYEINWNNDCNWYQLWQHPLHNCKML